MKMSENRNQLFAGVTASLFMLLFCKWLTGEVCHAILGMLLAGMSVVHVWRHMARNNSETVVRRCWPSMIKNSSLCPSGL